MRRTLKGGKVTMRFAFNLCHTFLVRRGMIMDNLIADVKSSQQFQKGREDTKTLKVRGEVSCILVYWYFG